MIEESDRFFDWDAFIRCVARVAGVGVRIPLCPYCGVCLRSCMRVVLSWMDAPAPADPRSKAEQEADNLVCHTYSKQAAKAYIKQQQFFDRMLYCQMQAVAALPESLRTRALVFDPILPPIHPRVCGAASLCQCCAVVVSVDFVLPCVALVCVRWSWDCDVKCGVCALGIPVARPVNEY